MNEERKWQVRVCSVWHLAVEGNGDWAKEQKGEKGSERRVIKGNDCEKSIKSWKR